MTHAQTVAERRFSGHRCPRCLTWASTERGWTVTLARDNPFRQKILRAQLAKRERHHRYRIDLEPEDLHCVSIPLPKTGELVKQRHDVGQRSYSGNARQGMVIGTPAALIETKIPGSSYRRRHR